MRFVILSAVLFTSSAFAAGHWGEPVKLPPEINACLPYDSMGDVYHARMSPDGTELYFTLENYKYDDDIYVARYNKGTDTWDSVTRLSINTESPRRELSPSITADHSKLFWCAWGLPGGYGGYDVWYAEWDSIAGDWGEPQNAGPNVNTSGYEFTCFISPDGKTLYNSSTYDSDGEDIYKHEWQDTCWGLREGVFEQLHPFGDEYGPWVSSDGIWLYYSRIYWVAEGRTIYRARWQGEYFGTPEWIGEPVGLPTGVTGEYQFNDGPSLNPEGSRIYFASNRPDSNSQGQYLWYSEYLDDVEEGKDFSGTYDLQVPTISRKEIQIAYSLPQGSQVFCCIFDTAGNLVRILVSGNQQGGEHQIEWDKKDDRGRKVSSGTYIIHLTVDKQKTIRKTIVIN